MHPKVIYLFVFLMCAILCRVSSYHHEAHGDKGLKVEAKISPDSSGGYQMTNNHFSTSEAENDVTTVSAGRDDKTTSKHESDDELRMPFPSEVPTTHKSNAKKEPKKKLNSTLKKKGKDTDLEITDSNTETTENVLDAKTTIDLTTQQVNSTVTQSSVPETTNEMDQENPEMKHMDTTVYVTTNAPDMTSVISTTTKGDSLTNEELHTTTAMVNEIMQDTTTSPSHEASETMQPQTHVILPSTMGMLETETTTYSDIFTVTENNIDSPTTVTHLHNIEEEMLKSEDKPTTIPTTLASDNNSLSNDLEDMVPTTMSHEFTTELTNVRKQKQMDLEKDCPCNERKTPLDPSECVGGRTTADPNCPCREVCARQNGQTCSLGEPCDEEFGLHCHPQNGTCLGQLSIKVFDITQNSAKVMWGSSKSELQPQALVFYSTIYRGIHTQWTKVQDIKPVITLDNLLPNESYYLKVEEDGKQEIATFKTKDNFNNMPKVLVKQRSQTTLTIVWDDFRLPSYHSEYILEYKPASDVTQNWTKVQAGTQTIVTITHLMLNTPYEIKVAVWEDDKLELPSEVITAYTADGCVRGNRMYNVGEEYFLECDFRCMCNGNNESDCSPRCNAPYVKIGSKTDDPLCYEKVIPSDPCCVIIRCTESRALEDSDGIQNKSGECPEILEDSKSETKSCLSDCDHDGDCSGTSKCCPSSCGGAVCVQPLIPQNVCEHVYCGPNAVCIASKMSCECSDGYEGDPHDFLSGCVPVNTSIKAENETHIDKSEFEIDLSPKQHGDTIMETTTISNKDLDIDSKNELSPENNDDEKELIPTDAPFELDLTLHKELEKSKNETKTADKENVNLKRLQDDNDGEINELKPETTNTNEEMPITGEKNITLEPPILFDGCEFNNVTYDKGVKFEDGCDAFCICEGQGHVSCVPRCNVLSSGGPACQEVPDPDDPCCKIMICSFPGNSESEHVDGTALPIKILSALAQNGTSIRVRLSISLSHLPAMAGRDIFEVWYRESSDSENDLSQWNKKAISQKDLSEVQQGVYEFDINELIPQTDYYIKVGKENQGTTSLDMAEFSNTVNVKTFPAAVKTVFQGCFHHNQSYSLGEVFYQGCEHKCICREKGFIECQDRCAIYIDTVGYEGCDWVPSEEDSCCSVPLCNRRKIPLLPGGTPYQGSPENICVVDNNEVYRVGDIWESGDGCKLKICRCTQLLNGTTSIQCQSECPSLPPNAHIPTARCPHPVLIKPDGPCSCPYVSCDEAPPRRVVQPPRPQCEFKGERYDMGQEFHDGCIALCHCGQDLRVNCAAIECPYHFAAEFTNCLEWDIDPDFFPVPPHCCAPAKCKNDGSCLFSQRKFENFQDIPTELLPCGARCVCVNGNVTCENRCPPIEDVPPINLPCPPNMAFKGHPEGETCCLQWMCKEPMKQAYCMFQGSRYLVGEKWEVHKGSQQRLCTCHMDAGHPEVECHGGCPQIPQRFLLPTEQCLRPVIVTPDDPLMCPYVVCNNTISGQELYNVNVVALNSTAVRVRFSLSNILVGLIGHAELHFTTDPTLPSTQWHIQKFSRPKRLFDSPNIEYILNALRPNTTYFLQVKIKIDALQGGPESEVFKLKMPEEIISSTTTPTTTTTTIPPMIIIDAKPEAHVIDAQTARISWKNIDPQEKKFIYALQLKYKMQKESEDKWITTPMIHRDVTSYFLHELEPLADYVVDMLFTPPKDIPTKIVSSKNLEFKTPGKVKEDYHLQVSVEDNKIGSDNSAFYFAGIPEPITKYVHVVKIMYKSADGEQSYSFKVPKSNQITLDHLKPGRKYLAQLELYLTNGQTLTSNEVEFITKPIKAEVNMSEAENVISHEKHQSVIGKQAEPLQSTDNDEDENRAYFIALVVVAVVAAVAGFGFVLLLVILVKRQASAKAPISRTPSESAYDNPTYKTYDGERLEDKTNGATIQTTQA